jgi:hypothetical protein
MLEALEWALLVFGFTYLMVAASIFSSLRRAVWRALPRGVRGVLACAPCASTWVGFFVGGLGWCPGPAHFWLVDASLSAIMALGFVAGFQGATGWVIAELAEADDEGGHDEGGIHGAGQADP